MKKLVSVVLMLCLLLACLSFAAAEANTVTVTVQGFSSTDDITVTVTAEDGVITSIVADGPGETPSRGGVVLETLPALMVEAQSADVESDVTSGATITATALKSAVKEAMVELGLAEATVAADDETVECDVLVIGMGASGTVAALSAAENGASVIGIERTTGLGGMGNAAQGMFAIGSVLQKERYGDTEEVNDKEYWFEHIMDSTRYLGNGKLISLLVNESADTVQYLLDHGIAIYLSSMPQQIAHFDDIVVYHRWNNTDPFTHFAEYLDQYGVDIRYSTTATALLTDADGNVVGAVATREDGSQLTVNAKAVIVATGGFAGNEEMMRAALGDDIYEQVSTIGGQDGSGLQMMFSAGAQEGTMLTMNHGIIAKNSELTVADQLTLNTPILWVNQQGKRFMNEDLLKDTVEFSSAVLAQGGYAYTIVDQATVDRWCDQTQENTGSWIHYWDRNGIVDENGEYTIYHAPIDRDTFLADFDALTASGDGIVADTLEEAAAFIGCDAADLQTTVANYNTYVENGEDPEFYKSQEDLIWTVAEGPFYVTKGCCQVLGALGGVNVNEKLQVLSTARQPIAGLYATGNNLSGISISAYGNVEGVGLSTALTTGRMAGLYAAQFAAE